MKFTNEGIFQWRRISAAILFLNFATVGSVLLLSNRLPPIVPIFYGAPAGSLQLASRSALFIPPGFALGIFVLNIGIATQMKDKFIDAILVISSLIFSILSTITVWRIMLLVGNIR